MTRGRGRRAEGRDETRGGKNAFFPRNDRPYGLKRAAFQTEIALMFAPVNIVLLDGRIAAAPAHHAFLSLGIDRHGLAKTIDLLYETLLFLYIVLENFYSLVILIDDRRCMNILCRRAYIRIPSFHS